MRWWPWKRRHLNEAAARAGAEAEDRLRDAHAKTQDVERATRAAHELTRRTDRFAREVERSMRLRRGPA